MAILPILGGVILIVPLTQLISGFLFYLLTLFISLISFYMGIQVFKAVQIEGINEYLSIPFSTQDLDHLQPISTDRFKKVQKDQFITYINNTLPVTNQVRIWRNYYEEKTFQPTKLVYIQESGNVIEYFFDQKLVIKIYDPEIYIIGDSFLKIHKASSIEVYQDDKLIEDHKWNKNEDIDIYRKGKKSIDRRFRKYPALVLFTV